MLVPVRFQLGVRLIRPLQLTEELLLVECLLVLQHEIDGPSELVGKDREGFAFAVFTGKSFQVLLGRFVASEEKDRRFREGPLEMGVADLVATGAVFLAVGFFGALDQPAVGDEVLDRGNRLMFSIS